MEETGPESLSPFQMSEEVLSGENILGFVLVFYDQRSDSGSGCSPRVQRNSTENVPT